MPLSDGSEAVIAFDGTTQIDNPSPRRGEISRAPGNASVVSAACSEPTCLCARPLRLRIKTSHNGVFGVVITDLPEILPEFLWLTPRPCGSCVFRHRPAPPRAPTRLRHVPC